VSEIECRLARILMAKGEYAEAAVLLRRSLAELEQSTEPCGEWIPVLQLLARCLWRSGDAGGAQVTIGRCRQLAGELLAPPEEMVKEGAMVRHGCDDEQALYRGDFTEQVSLLRDVLAEEAKGQPPAYDPEEMPHWEVLAEMEERLGDREAAREAYAQAVAGWEKVLSPGHPRAGWAREQARRLTLAA
jgi:tetratricopeptide (TPR) repeat protein